MRFLSISLSPLLLLLPLTSTHAAPIVSLQPALVTALPDSSFSLTFSAEDVVDLYAFQFELSFAPKLLTASAVIEGPFLAQGGSTIFRPGPIDNDMAE